jgi:hypothetical protein
MLRFLVFGGLVLCTLGILVLVMFLIFDSRDKKIW